nr:retrovirus-related Pol polyprotein from transposon TNT 1-94 [Tanacetum cinerariifolium]
NTCLVETDDSNVILYSPDMCEDAIQNDQNDVKSNDERFALPNLISNLNLDVDENKKIQKQLQKANTTLAQELKECKTILAKTKKSLGESISVRDSCLVALQTKQAEFEKLILDGEETLALERESRFKLNKDLVRPYDYTTLNNLYEIFKPPTQEYKIQLAHTNEIRRKMWRKSFVKSKPNIYKNVEIVDNAWIKHSKDQFHALTAQDMEILIQTCLMSLATKTQNDSFGFVHELKQEMHADLNFKCLSKSEQYVKIQDLKAQLQDKNIANSELKKLIKKGKGKYVDTKFDKPSVVRQPNAQRIPKPSVLGKPTPFLNSLDRIYFPKTKSILKDDVSEGLSKPVTAHTLPQTARQAVSNTNVLKPGMYRINNRSAHTRAPQLPQTVRNTNPHVSTSTGVNHKPNVSRPQLKSNQSRDKVVPKNSQVKVKKTQVEVHIRIPSVSNKMKSVTACKDNLNSRTLNANFVCATCNKCLVDSNHFACVTKMLNDMNARTKKPNHMTCNLRLLCNFVEKFLGTVRFSNDQFAPILGYGDLVQRNVTVNRVYYVEGLNHNLFSVGQFCDVDLEVAFRKSTCIVRDLQGNVLITGNRGFDLYIISLQESTSSTPLCLMAKASPTQAWLWHQRLSHLNFDYINMLLKKDIMIGLLKLKYVKDQLCSSCELSKAKEAHSSQSINGKKYILVIVDDYSRYTWTLFLHSKDEIAEVLKEFLTMIQKNLHALVITVRTDRGTEFLNKTLNAFFKEEGIEHQTSTARTPEHNGVVERQNRTLRFNELSLMCPRMVELEQVKVDGYIRGLTDNIKGEVTSSKPADLNKAVRMSHKLMEQKSQARDARILEGKLRKWESLQGGNRSGKGNQRDNSRHTFQNSQKQGNERAIVTALTDGKLPLQGIARRRVLPRGIMLSLSGVVMIVVSKVILGMDVQRRISKRKLEKFMAELMLLRMLSLKRDAIIIYGEKVVHIPYGNEMLIVKSDKGVSRLKEKQMEDVLVIRDFLEVFPEELPGLPPPSQVEFRIDLVTGVICTDIAKITRKPNKNGHKNKIQAVQ